MSPPSATADIPREVDPQIWRTCAGASVQIPSLYSRVYYFPQGHVEHSCPSSLISSFSSAPVPCIVSSVELLADLITDEVFAHLALQPMVPRALRSLQFLQIRERRRGEQQRGYLREDFNAGRR
ncbi:hypothetical protein Bca52824_007133 [Brassica carinata]|uniref:Uncharacterized protein n=1 Tax=Brassica carinata TaxID=52824 RepID=A0A8X7W8M4_BRACI|nr:hypothetical protein Bca52824_007133 [Brassica carinata]